MELDIKNIEMQIKSIQEQRRKIEQEFFKRYPTIKDGKIKKYALSEDGRYYTDISQIPDKDKHLFMAGLRTGSNSFMPGALYYEEDHIRPTNLDDMKKYPEWENQVARLWDEEQRLVDIIKQKNAEKNRIRVQEQQAVEKNMRLLRQFFPGTDLNDCYYQFKDDGQEAVMVMKGLDQLVTEKEFLYQRLSQIAGSVEQKKEILNAIDVVYDGYINQATTSQKESKAVHK